MARKLGIDYAVNIQKEDVQGLINKLTDGYGADVVLECSGSEAGVRTGLEFSSKKEDISADRTYRKTHPV